MRETPDFAKQKFLYRLSRSDYEKEWGKDYVKPGVGTRILSTLLRYVPKNRPLQEAWDSTIRLHKQRICTSRASILRSIDTGPSSRKWAQTNSCSSTTTLTAEIRPLWPNIPSRTTHTPNCSGNWPRASSITRRPSCAATSCEFYSDLPASVPTKDDKVSSADLLAWLNQLKAASLTPATEPLAAR